MTAGADAPAVKGKLFHSLQPVAQFDKRLLRGLLPARTALMHRNQDNQCHGRQDRDAASHEGHGIIAGLGCSGGGAGGCLLYTSWTGTESSR